MKIHTINQNAQNQFTKLFPIPFWKLDHANASLKYPNLYKKNIPTLIYQRYLQNEKLSKKLSFQTNYVKDFYKQAKCVIRQFQPQQFLKNDKTAYSLAQELKVLKDFNIVQKVRNLIKKASQNISQFKKQAKSNAQENHEHKLKIRNLINDLQQCIIHVLECGGQQKFQRQRNIKYQLKTNQPHSPKGIVCQNQNIRTWMSRKKSKQKIHAKRQSDENLSDMQKNHIQDQSVLSIATNTTFDPQGIISPFLDLVNLRDKWKKNTFQVQQTIRRILTLKLLANAQKEKARKNRIYSQQEKKFTNQQINKQSKNEKNKSPLSLQKKKEKEKNEKELQQQIEKKKQIRRKKRGISLYGQTREIPNKEQLYRSKISNEFVNLKGILPLGFIYQKTKKYNQLISYSNLFDQKLNSTKLDRKKEKSLLQTKNSFYK